MAKWLKAALQHRNQRWRGKHRHLARPRPRTALDVAIRRPRQQRIGLDHPGTILERDIRACRQLGDLSLKRALLPGACAALGMQLPINSVNGPAPFELGKRAQPGASKTKKVVVPALGARAVAGGHGRGFVEEEQLGIAAWPHDLAVPSAKLEPAGDPAPHLRVADDPPLIVVQDAAIAHQRPSSGHGDDRAKGRNAITQRTVYQTPGSKR
jgi:hypothetical protein